MKLICIFKGDKLLDYTTQYNENSSKQYKEAIAQEKLCEVSEVEAVCFEDEELGLFINAGSYLPTRRVDIYRDHINLIKLEPSYSMMGVEVDWKNCTQEKIEELFSEEDILKIQENKEYFESLGPEKFRVGFKFEWPHIIPTKVVDMQTSRNEEVIYKTVSGVVLEDII